MSTTRKKYKIRNFVGDVIMLIITGGVWAIYMIIREWRNR